MKEYPAAKAIGAINLDTVGRLGDGKLLVLDSSSAREWKFIFMGAGYVSGVEAEMVTQDLDSSDQGIFIKAGVPAVQIFTGATKDYHRPSDTAEKIDGPGLVKIAGFVREGIVYLSERAEPLSFAGRKGGAERPAGGGQRKATAGTMPDFSYSGPGVKIGEPSPDSPAAMAGLEKGDIIVKLGEHEITDLKSYAAALSSFDPGDVVPLEYIRGGERKTTKITLKAR
jgi:membrane-associated protease RseP (regulator of RpoE activity)